MSIFESRAALALTVVFGVVVFLCDIGVVNAQSQAKLYQLNIAAGDLIRELEELGESTGLTLVYDKQLVAGKRAGALNGQMDVDTALKQLLSGTGVAWSFVNGNTVVLKRAVAKKDSTKTDGQISTLNHAPQEGSDTLAEVTVTAEKREERLQDTPVPVAVINTQQLAVTDQVLLRDYFATVPSLSVTPNLIVAQIIAIRGISTGDYTAPTVAVMIDGLPQSSSLGATSELVPDIDPFDLARIEVLRGPQGTLYGANSLGGLINYVTVEPSTEAFSGRVQAGTSSVYNGAELGYNFRAAVNVPISDTFAIRVSGYEREDPGYIDNILSGQDGINETRAEGARLAGLWRPTDDFSLRFSALYQHTSMLGKSEVVAGLGDLQQNYPPGVGPTRQDAGAYSLVLNYKIGGVSLSSSTGYNFNHAVDSFDATSFYSPSQLQAFGVSAASYPEGETTGKFTEEIRVTGSGWQDLDWLAGLFYSHERNSEWDNALAVNGNTGQVAGVLETDLYPIFTYKEYSAFGDLTYHFTDQFDVQIGGRGIHEQTYFGPSSSSGPNIGPSTLYFPSAESAANAFTYLLTPRFKISPDLMVYARLASGYRPGGPNFALSIAQGAPISYQPDKTYNYEVGFKGDFLDHRLSVDSSLYYIDWKGIQLQLDTPEYNGYYTNGSSAKSEGVELTVLLRPLDGLTVAAWGTFDNAVLTQAFPANSTVTGAPGDRLPITARFSGNVSVQEEFPLGNDTTGFVGGQFSYVGDRDGLFVAAPPRQIYPAYTKTDLRAGVKYDSWTINLYANNVADRRGILNTVDFFPNEVIYLQPRTVGLNVSKNL